jgi:hypothetical protein
MSLAEQSEVQPSAFLRTFSPDDLEPEDYVLPTSRGEFELVLGPKHLIVILTLLLTQMGLVAGIAYTAGRSAAVLPPVHAPAKTVAAVTAPATPAPPVKNADPSPAPKSTAVPVVNNLTPERPPAGLYLQVGSVDLSSARKMAADLASKGFSTRLAPGATENIYRVLVGPSDGPANALALQEAGFMSFPKRY